MRPHWCCRWCSDSRPDAWPRSRSRVAVSILPQKYFVERIGGDAVRVTVMVPPGADPHSYEPRPRQMTELSASALYLAIGVDFERAWLKRLRSANPDFEGRPHGRGDTEASDGSGRRGTAHGAGEPDPHIWLSPPLVKTLAGNILQALAAADPGNRAAYEERCARFLQQVEALDAELKTVFADRRGTRFIVLHPAWGYFADAYGLEQIPIEIEGKDPKPAQLAESHPQGPVARHHGRLRPAAVLDEDGRAGGARNRGAGDRGRRPGRKLAGEPARHVPAAPLRVEVGPACAPTVIDIRDLCVPVQRRTRAAAASTSRSARAISSP